MGHDRTPLGVGTSVRLSVFFWVAVVFRSGSSHVSGFEASIGRAVFSVSPIFCEPFEVGCPDTRTLIQPNPFGDCETIISWDDRLTARKAVSHRQRRMLLGLLAVLYRRDM